MYTMCYCCPQRVPIIRINCGMWGSVTQNCTHPVPHASTVLPLCYNSMVHGPFEQSILAHQTFVLLLKPKVHLSLPDHILLLPLLLHYPRRIITSIDALLHSTPVLCYFLQFPILIFLVILHIIFPSSLRSSFSSILIRLSPFCRSTSKVSLIYHQS